MLVLAAKTNTTKGQVAPTHASACTTIQTVTTGLCGQLGLCYINSNGQCVPKTDPTVYCIAVNALSVNPLTSGIITQYGGAGDVCDSVLSGCEYNNGNCEASMDEGGGGEGSGDGDGDGEYDTLSPTMNSPRQVMGSVYVLGSRGDYGGGALCVDAHLEFCCLNTEYNLLYVGTLNRLITMRSFYLFALAVRCPGPGRGTH